MHLKHVACSEELQVTFTATACPTRAPASQTETNQQIALRKTAIYLTDHHNTHFTQTDQKQKKLNQTLFVSLFTTSLQSPALVWSEYTINSPRRMCKETDVASLSSKRSVLSFSAVTPLNLCLANSCLLLY